MVTIFHSNSSPSVSALFLFLNFAIGGIYAVPWPAHVKHSTHHVRHVGRALLQVNTYHPTTTFKTYGTEGKEDPLAASLTGGSAPALDESALAFIQSELGMSPDQVGYKSGYTTSDKSKFAYVRQYHDGVPFANAVANIAWNDGKIVAFGNSFVDISNIESSKPTLDVSEVMPNIEQTLDAKCNDQAPQLEYLVQDDGSVSLTHVFQVRNEDKGTWFEAFASAHTGKLLSVTDFVADASYTVVPITSISVDDGLEKIVDPQDLQSSPLGWHADGDANSTVTAGNNVAAFFLGKSKKRIVSPETSPGLNFDLRFDDSRDPNIKTNALASMVNGFFVANVVHDVAYRYGFTEKSFNFQNSNFGKGGKENDGVLMSVQDASGVNNANFASPPDGQAGICRMFLWTFTDPGRDGAMENDIVVHEMTHGITNRLTGGGTGRCLQTVEAGGLGEGWSDTMAEWISQSSDKVEDFGVGTYVTDNKDGLRSHPYSTNPKVNPLRYSSLADLNEVHAIGEVWANMLHNVFAALVKDKGFSKNALTNPDTKEGNVVFMHLFIDALSIQPCNPTFVEARDAWIQADQNRYKGEHKCLISKEFAKLGLGTGAGPDFKDNTEVLDGC